MTNARELAENLGVRVADVIKALMAAGYMKTATQPLTEDEVEVVTLLLTSGRGPVDD